MAGKEFDPRAGSVQPTECKKYKRRETTSGSYTYVGYALGTSLTSEAKWQIIRYDNTNGSRDLADGNDEYDNVFDNATSLSYS